MDLKEIQGLKEEEVDLLFKNWITTAEEFISISANDSLIPNLKTLLQVSDKRFNEISNIIEKKLPKNEIDSIKAFKNIQIKTGAKKSNNQ